MQEDLFRWQPDVAQYAATQVKQSNLSKFALLSARLIRRAMTNHRGLREVCGVALSTLNLSWIPPVMCRPFPAGDWGIWLAEEREPLALAVQAFPQVRCRFQPVPHRGNDAGLY